MKKFENDKIKFIPPVRVKLSYNTIKGCLSPGLIDYILRKSLLIESYRDQEDGRMVFVCSKHPEDNIPAGIFFEEIK